MKRIFIVLFAAVVLTGTVIFASQSLSASLNSANAEELEAPSTQIARISEENQEPEGVIDDSSMPVSSSWLESVRDHIRRSEYQISWQASTQLGDLAEAYHAPNRAHNLRTYFTEDGIRVIPRTGDISAWEFGLSLQGYGLGESLQEVSNAALSPDSNRVQYQRSNISEWYLNNQQGLDHGITISQAPYGAGDRLVIELALNGNLKPEVADAGNLIQLTSPYGKQAIRYGNLSAVDAAGIYLPAFMKLAGPDSNTLQLVIDTTNSVFPVTVNSRIEGLYPDYNWIAVNNQLDAAFGTSVGTAGDVNNDNYDDVIVGAPGFDNGEADEGRVYVYMGSENGLSTTEDWTAESDQEGANFGVSVGTAGNVNGDDYDDVIIGSDMYDAIVEDVGAAFVYHGSASGLGGTIAWFDTGNADGDAFGEVVGTAGDVNNDTYDDVIVGAPSFLGSSAAYVYHGTATGLNANPDWTQTEANVTNYALSVSTAGDVNGDNYDDVIVGGWFSNGYAGGVAFVYYGSATTLSSTSNWTVGLSQTLADYGSAVGDAGDVNDDGYGDIIVGAAGFDTATISDTGKVFVYYGSDLGLNISEDWSALGDSEGAGLGNAVDTAGDANGDGYDDVIIAADAYDNLGRVYLYQGSVTGLDTAYDWFGEGEQTFTGFGISIGPAGDVNGDSLSDVIIGASEYFSGNDSVGAAYVFHGAPDLLATNDSPTDLGEITNLTATTTIQGTFVYTWNFGDGSPLEGGQYASHVYPAVGDYTATVTATEGEIELTDTTDVIIDIAITGLEADNDSPTTLGDTTALSATIATGTNVTYEWDFGDSSPLGSGMNVTHDYAAVGTYIASVTASNSLGSQTTTTTVIVDETIAGLTAENDGPTVLGEQTAFTAAVTAGSNVTYAWDFGDGSTGTGSNATYTYATVGSYTATVTATNSVGEQSTTTQVIVDVPIAGLSADNDSPTALGDTTSLTATITAGSNVTYSWTFGDGDSGSGANPTHTYAAVGGYVATVTASNSVSSDSTTTNVAIEETIAGLSADNDGPTALGDTTTFTATITAGSDVTYAWDFGDGDSGSGANPTHTYAAVGNYTATVTATNNVSSQSTTTNVTVDITIAGLSAENDSPTVLSETTTFTATITAGSNVTYAWDFGDGNSGSGANPTHVYAAPGNYLAEVTATNSVGSPTATTRVTVDEVITGLDADNDGPTTLGQTTTLTATVTAGSNVTYDWDFGDGKIGSGANPTHVYTAIGTYIAEVTASNSVGSDTATTIIEVKDVPIAGLTAANDSPTFIGTVTNLSASVTAGTNVTYVWNFGDGSAEQEGALVTHIYPEAKTYVATVTAKNGVSAPSTTTVVIISYYKIHLPVIYFDQ